ncbi:deuterolysin m35 metalloprotease [Moniliophthora roreri MCA 2997]|uniref:Deuterolysin m35 metalloprotease n=1 Tax=Moniliophthora roreri (strain MCA 2997) TaxID=1381753 RepID=V2XEL6_MONRO|nr:deuterolysin m35 metalloprotease [Moniliophthora roreri MCA 2997]
MFATTVILATLFATEVAYGAPGLSLSVSAPASIDGVDNFKVTATLTNTGGETLKLLNDPRGPLSQIPTDTFSILSSTGSSPSFNGVKAKYVPSNVIKENRNGSFTVLEPGKSVSIEHDLSAAYNFTTAGEGAYTVEARNLFHFVDANTGKAVPVQAASSKFQVASLTGKLAVARPPVAASKIIRRGLRKRTGFVGCNDDQINQVFEAIPVTQGYVAESLQYLQANPGATERYTTWFGEFTKDRHSLVTSQYQRLTENDYPNYTFDCTCTDEGVYAFVNIDDFGVVHLCGAFWRAPVSGTDSKGGTILHEASHFRLNAQTQDNAYSQSACQSLAQSDPDAAIANADSHEYFGENTPALP